MRQHNEQSKCHCEFYENILTVSMCDFNKVGKFTQYI